MEKVGNIANYLASAILLVFGLTYLFKNSFMPYHAEAMSAEWNNLPSNTQTLVLALMRAVGGGFLTSSVVIAILQTKFKTQQESWMAWCIFFCGFIMTASSIYATLIVRFNSPGKPPTLLASIGIVLLLIGLVFNLKSIKRSL